MKLIKKLFVVLGLVAIVTTVMAGCHVTTTKSFMFNVDNGDAVTVELETNGGYDLTSDIPFVISRDGVTQAQGQFIYGDAYMTYASEIPANTECTVLDQGTTEEGNSYIFWNYGNEYNYAMMINGTSTGVVIGSTLSQEAAQECFDRLEIAPYEG